VRGCNVYGQPSLGTDLEDYEVKLKTAWARIRAGLTDEHITQAHEMRRR